MSLPVSQGKGICPLSPLSPWFPSSSSRQRPAVTWPSTGSYVPSVLLRCPPQPPCEAVFTPVLQTRKPRLSDVSTGSGRLWWPRSWPAFCPLPHLAGPPPRLVSGRGVPLVEALAPGAGQSRPSALRAGGGEVAAVLALAVLPGRGLSSHGAPGTEAPTFGWWDEAQGGSPGRQAHRDAWWRAVAGAEGQGLGRRWRGEPGRCPRHRGRGAGVPGPPGEVGDSDRE